MNHTAKDYSALLGVLEGISDDQLKAHFGLYEGYVKKLNEIEEKLRMADRGATNYSYGEFSELKRRESVAFNGAYLHELYFESLGAYGEPSEELRAQIVASFGSFEKWDEDLKASASSTPGWVLLTWNLKDKSLHHYILFEHHVGLPAFQVPIMALDCWEHAFMIDYGTKKADYLTAFRKNINWDNANKLFSEVL
ncbi:hypothetical protein KKC94_02725 [Patescibacteria group bacterium]|nr:hypothetical protein [Patescibacteria group bacterium]